MSASMTWTGLTELVREMGGFPKRLEPAAAKRLLAGANRAASAIRQRYDAIPRYEGDTDGPGLAKGVRVDSTEPLAPRVKSTAFHAHLYEFGTGPRQTASGARRGSMPAANVMVPISEAERARLGVELGEVLKDPEVVGGARYLEIR